MSSRSFRFGTIASTNLECIENHPMTDLSFSIPPIDLEARIHYLACSMKTEFDRCSNITEYLHNSGGGSYAPCSDTHDYCYGCFLPDLTGFTVHVIRETQNHRHKYQDRQACNFKQFTRFME